MFWGLLLSAASASMVWPFLLIYVSRKIEQPLTVTATLMTINAVMSVISSFMAGAIADRVGRKGVMVFSLLAETAGFILLINASTYTEFALLMALRGFANPLYRVGADAMLADMIPKDERIEAYALIRMVNNAGIAIGPIIGGALVATSYTYAFLGAAAGIGIYAILLAIMARETLQKSEPIQHAPVEPFAGYGRVLRDGNFFPPIALIMFGWMTATLMWIVLPVYANTNFNVPENIYAWIPTTNALMVVFLQMPITRITRHLPARRMMALGMLLYALSNGLVALSDNFAGFWACMVLMTIGELIIVPTSSAYVANIAPADMRGRYMSIYGLTWAVGQGIGPIFAGLMNDNYGPRSIWMGSMTVGLISALGLYLFSTRAVVPIKEDERD
jgi:MFS family permease